MGTPALSTEPDIPAAELSEQQRGIIALLREDIEAQQKEFEACDEQRRRTLSKQYLAPLHNALSLAGLEPLAQAAALLMASEHPGEWCTPLLRFLTALEANALADPHIEALASVVLAASPKCDIGALRKSLGAAKMGDVEDDNPLPDRIDNTMCGLQPAADVDTSLLSAMLAELPAQSEQFSEAVARWSADCDAQALNTAQRLAHTLKGAGNLVSIPGIAQLMHLSEALMEWHSEHESAKSAGADGELLQRVADALAESAEHLLEGSPEPEDLQAVMSDLLNCVKTKSGASEDLSPTPDPSPQYSTSPSPATQAPVPQKAPSSIKTPPTQTLLRHAGELQIGHFQEREKLRQLQQGFSWLKTQQKQVKTLALELERLLQKQSVSRAAALGGEGDRLDPLELEQFSELHTFSNRLLEVAEDGSEGIETLSTQLHQLDTLHDNLQQVQREHQEQLLALNMVPVSSVRERLARCVRQTSRMTGKPAVFAMHGEHVMVDRDVLFGILDALMHLLRNAIDHGLENAEERVALGKHPEGHITAHFELRGDALEIRVEDDGRGLDATAIHRKAINSGLIGEGEAELSPEAITGLLFTPGFTTRNSANHTSGRGIGLDAVHAAVLGLKGQIRYESTPNRGLVWHLRLPTTLLRTHALIARHTRADGSTADIVIAARGIAQIHYLGEDEIVPAAAKTLSGLLGESASGAPIRAMLSLLGDDGSSRCKIRLEQVIDSRDVVVKALNAYTPNVPGVIGATLLGDGQVAPVYDLPGLLAATQHANAARQLRQTTPAQTPAQKTQVLVVDDSLSARKSLAQFLGDMGLEVITAKDGFDAIDALHESTPDAVIVDLEMPRMNGLELTSHIRANREIRTLPVIMVTSRSTDRHRQLATRAGVDHYLTKPWNEGDLMDLLREVKVLGDA